MESTIRHFVLSESDVRSFLKVDDHRVFILLLDRLNFTRSGKQDATLEATFFKSNQPTIQQNNANIQCYIKSIPKPTVRIKPISQSYDLSIRSTLPRSFNTKSNQTNYFII